MEQSPDSGKRRGRASLVIIIILVTIGIVVAIWGSLQRSGDGESSRDATKSQFYGALGNAAKQQKLRVGMYRETFATRTDADARRNVGTVSSSVSEVDTEAGKYRSVFATNTFGDEGFRVGRCIDNVTYGDYYQPPAIRTDHAKTLSDAATRLKLIPEGNLYEVTQPLQFITCPHLGLMPANPPIAMSRLSDGVFPVTLSPPQAKKWQEKIEKADFFEVKDEGIMERGGKKLRKISFKPKADDDWSINKKLYDIFYEAGEIAKIKAEQPRAEVDYEFQPINPMNTGSIGGFYLIDESKNLPVYSELYGTNPDKQGESGVAKRNIARTKQTYAYPAQLTLSLDTPLEFLE